MTGTRPDLHDDGGGGGGDRIDGACSPRASRATATDAAATTRPRVRVRLRCRDAAVRIRDDALRRGSRDNVSVIVCATFEGSCATPDAVIDPIAVSTTRSNENTSSISGAPPVLTAATSGSGESAESEVAAAKRRRRAAEVRRIVGGYARARDARLALESARLLDAEQARRRRAASAFGDAWLDKSAPAPIAVATPPSVAVSSASASTTDLVLSVSADESTLIGYLRDPQIGVLARSRSVASLATSDPDTFSAQVFVVAY